MQRLKQNGFTLLELLVVISIIALLVGLLLPALGASRQAGRKAVCASHLHQLGVAGSLYLDTHKEQFWRYYTSLPGGRQWWFGYEPGGPGSGTNRPLDKSRSVMADYLATDTDAFNCPAFPYDDAGYYRKFNRHGASFGYNLSLGPASLAIPPRRRIDLRQSESEVFLFADGIHFDHNPVFNEGHYIIYNANPMMKSGYAHFRHGGTADVLMLDGHAASQKLQGVGFANGYEVGGGPAGNLVASDGSNRIYGFNP